VGAKWGGSWGTRVVCNRETLLGGREIQSSIASEGLAMGGAVVPSVTDNGC
jgi:hypothetical protein